MSLAHKGKKHSLESINKMKQRKPTEETKEKLRITFAERGNPFQGKHHSEESKNKIRLAHLGKKSPPSVGEKLKEYFKICGHPRCRTIQIDNVIYPSIMEASKVLNISKDLLIYRLKNLKMPTYQYLS